MRSQYSRNATLIATTAALMTLDGLEGRRLMAAPTSIGPDLVTIASYSNGEYPAIYVLNSSFGDDRLAFKISAVENDAGSPTLSITINQIGNAQIKQIIDWDAGSLPGSLQLEANYGNDRFEIRTSGLEMLGNDQDFCNRIWVDMSNGNDRVQTWGDLAGLTGGAGNDTMYGSAFDDNIYADTGNDYISAGAGNDTVNPGSGADKVYLGGGNNVVRWQYISYQNGLYNQLDAIPDTIVGGSGYDRAEVWYSPIDAVYVTTIFTNLGKQKLFGVNEIAIIESDKG